MPYLAVDENGDAYIFENKPVRDYHEWMPNNKQFLSIPKGTIRKLIGRDLTWQDDPVELTEKMVKEPEKPDYYAGIEWVNDWAKWRAIDLTGLVNEFEFEPYANGDCQMWDIVGDTEQYKTVKVLKNTVPDWQSTLQERITK